MSDVKSNTIQPQSTSIVVHNQNQNSSKLLEDLTFSFPRRHRSGICHHRLSTKVWGSGNSSNMMVVNLEDEHQLHEKVDYKKRDVEGIFVTYVNGDEVDLNFLACIGDIAFNEELLRITHGMSRENLIDFIERIDGEWCDCNKRRKVVVASEIVKVLPINWKIELAICTHGGLPSLFCHNYVSPTGHRLKSCRDVALYLKEQTVPNGVGAPRKREMRHKSNGCHTVPKSENKVASSSVLETHAKLPAVDNLYDVKVASLIECAPCGLAFENLSALEKHLGNFHKKTTRRFDLPTTQGTGYCISEKHAVMDRDEPHQNGHMSSDSQQMIEAQEPAPVINGKFKTDCTWCSKEFLCEPVDAETMADASGFMCPQCKDKTWGFFERSLSKSSQH